jgi:hypothetical protein
MIGNFESFTLELPLPVDADRASQDILIAILGILRRGYPGEGRNRVQPQAMELYAGRMAQAMDGIYQDMIREEKDFVIRVTWDDSGVPSMTVVGKKVGKRIIAPKRRSIIKP